MFEYIKHRIYNKVKKNNYFKFRFTLLDLCFQEKYIFKNSKSLKLQNENCFFWKVLEKHVLLNLTGFKISTKKAKFNLEYLDMKITTTKYILRCLSKIIISLPQW